MTTLPHSPLPLNTALCTAAVTEATRRALAAYPHATEGEKARMRKGALLALEGKVIVLQSGYAEVASQFGTCTYTVNGTCPCALHKQHDSK